MSDKYEFPPEQHHHRSSFVKGVTNEYALFFYRFVTGASCLVLVWVATDIKTSTTDMRRDFVEFRYANERRMATMENQIIELHQRQDNHDTDLHAIWLRILDIAARFQIPPPPPEPKALTPKGR